MSVDQAREEWQAAGDYDSACRLIRAQADRIGQLERELVAERENNVGEFESRSEAERKVRALKAQVMGLERELADFKASQHYRYIGVDGKPVLARELEDRAIKAERELVEARVSLGNIGQELRNASAINDAALAELAAEKALADRLWRMVKGVALMDEACDTCDVYRKARGL